MVVIFKECAVVWFVVGRSVDRVRTKNGWLWWEGESSRDKFEINYPQYSSILHYLNEERG
jgi:hypothetical protein